MPKSEHSGLADISAAVHLDVRRMEEALSQSDYDVKTWGLEGEDPGITRNTLKRIIKDACNNAPKDGVLLLYFRPPAGARD